MAAPWGFYGRQAEREALLQVFGRERWFFVKVTGRRRIGKTALIQQALKASDRRLVFYCQLPDSGPSGLLSAVADAMDMFQIDPRSFPRPTSLHQLAKTVAGLARAGYVVALDEFQYVNRERLRELASLLQNEIDQLSAQAHAVPGGLLVLGSIYSEMAAVLDDRSAPLYNRVTDEIDLGHLDMASLLELLRAHDAADMDRLLFLWTLFEGVPKFYRDCYEQGVLAAPRAELLEKMFFLSSSPLRSEADNWFLKELHGRYDTILKLIARQPGRTHGEMLEQIRQMSPDSDEQIGGYLKVLIEKYRMIERRQPIFAPAKAKRGRYYLTDNFLTAWLGALAGPVAALAFAPLERLVTDADHRLHELEGHAFERLVAMLYEERSRRRLGDFPLTARIEGYWDSADTEIDFVALDEEARRIRFGHCKRAPERLLPALASFEGHVQRFLASFPQYGSWQIDRVAFAPKLGTDLRRTLASKGWLAQDLADLTAGLA